MRSAAYVLSADEIPLAVIQGVSLAGAVSAIPFIVGGPLILAGFLITSSCWLAGVAVIGAPVWWALHKLKLATPESFYVAGAVSPGVGILPLLQPWNSGVSLWAVCAIIFGLIGGLAGLVMHGCAYRKDALAEAFS